MTQLTPEQVADGVPLMPCPFCGGKARDNSHCSCDCCGKAFTGQVDCIACGASVSHFNTRAEAIAALQAENERLRGEYICKCGLRVEPHRCADTKGDF